MNRNDMKFITLHLNPDNLSISEALLFSLSLYTNFDIKKIPQFRGCKHIHVVNTLNVDPLRYSRYSGAQNPETIHTFNIKKGDEIKIRADEILHS